MRLRVLAALTLDDGSAADVFARAGVSERDGRRALARLAAAGVARADRGRWRLDQPALVAAARTLAATRTGPEPDEPDPVLRAFLRGGRLTAIPAARAKRLVMLDHVARVFEPGRRYPEREVNAYLRAFHDDVAALRRYLVDEGFLGRERGWYWRTGGTVDV